MVALGAELPFQNGKWIDLTHEFSSETLYWPTAKGFTLNVEFKDFTPKGYWYTAYGYSASEHGGTHLDSPIHFAKDRKTTDQLPIEQLMGPAAVIDVSKSASTNRDYQIKVSDIENWEQLNGKLHNDAILLFRTGFGSHWPNAEKYLGTAEKGLDAVAKLRFPGIHPDTARWLVDNRKIKAVGIDTASIDYGQSTMFETHRILFEKNIPAFENVAALEKLPEKGAYVIALPMKIKGGSGGPLRVVAFIKQ